MKNFFNAIITIAARDITKFLNDRQRIFAAFIFPLIFTGILARGNQAAFGAALPYNIVLFTFIGNMASTMFQSTTQGIVSLLEDRDNDFAQEMFVAPISRYAIVTGKIVGEVVVSTILLLPLVIVSFIAGAGFDALKVPILLPFLWLTAFLGGAMGLVIISFMNNFKSANQVFGLILFPQFFLAGIFMPVISWDRATEWIDKAMFILSRISPLTYAVDMIRNVYYWGSGDTAISGIVINTLWMDILIVLGFTCIFVLLGTYKFIQNEKNK